MKEIRELMANRGLNTKERSKKDLLDRLRDHGYGAESSASANGRGAAHASARAGPSAPPTPSLPPTARPHPPGPAAQAGAREAASQSPAPRAGGASAGAKRPRATTPVKGAGAPPPGADAPAPAPAGAALSAAAAPGREVPCPWRTAIAEGTMEVVGKGLSGEVRRYRHGSTDVVMKEVTDTEIDALKRLGEHPHIVQILGDVAPDGSGPRRLVMEPAPYDLYKALYHLDLPVEDRVFYDLANGLEHVHMRHLAHCDLKSSNVLLAQGRAKLCDFGSAREVREGELQGAPTPSTNEWAAPEAFDHDAVQTTMRDIWSLGCVYLEMLCRLPPWECALIDRRAILEKDDPEDRQSWTAEQLRKGSLPYPGWFLERTPAVVQRCFSFDSAGRPSASTVQRELEQYFAEKPEARLAGNRAQMKDLRNAYNMSEKRQHEMLSLRAHYIFEKR